MTARANRLAKPRVPRTPASEFAPVPEVRSRVISDVCDVAVDFDSAFDAQTTHARHPSPNVFEDPLPRFSHPDIQRSMHDDSNFERTTVHPGRLKEKASVVSRPRLFDAPFVRETATTPPSTYAVSPKSSAPLARARVQVPPPSPSSTGSSLSPLSLDDSGQHLAYGARVGAATVMVPRPSRGLPAWLYAGLAATVILAAGLFAMGSRAPQAAAAATAKQDAQVAQAVQQPAPVQNTPVAVPVAQAPVAKPILAVAPTVDPALAAALGQPTQTAPEPMAATPVPVKAVPTSKAVAQPQAHFVHPVHAAPPPAPIARAPRPIAAPAPAAIPAPIAEGGHDVRTSQQTSAAASKVIGDSL